MCRSCSSSGDFFFPAEDGIRDLYVTGVQTCALPICGPKKPTKKVITNADVKKSSGKLTTLPAAATSTAPAAAPKMSVADQDKLLHDRAAAQKRTDAAQAKVNDLDKELDRLEQAYYAENDPNYRDKTIAERFEQTKKQLESARKDLAEAREALEKLKL